MDKVAIIIVNYNGQKYLPDLLGSIFSYKPQAVSQEVIIIDNASTDGSIGWLRQNYPKIIIFTQLKNAGFAKGNNIGIRYAIDNGFDYVMLLNQDTIVTEGYLDKLIAKAESDNQVAAVQPKLMLYPRKDLINSVGNIIHFLGFGYTYGHKNPISNFQFQISNINYCAGAACLIKVGSLKKVGLFNERLFMYHEDLDLGWRFQLSGHKNMVEPDAIVYHQYEFSRSIKKYYYMERNRYIVLLQNYKCATILLIWPALILMEIGLFLFSFFNGWWLEKLKVYAYFLNPLNWSRILKTRRQIQNVRVKSDREVVANFSGIIQHQEINNLFIAKVVNPIFNIYWQVIKRLIVW